MGRGVDRCRLMKHPMPQGWSIVCEPTESKKSSSKTECLSCVLYRLAPEKLSKSSSCPVRTRYVKPMISLCKGKPCAMKSPLNPWHKTTGKSCNDLVGHAYLGVVG